MTPDLPARLAALPEVRAAAEAQAKALVDERQRLFPSSLTWVALPFPMRREHIETNLTRLLDPLNPAAEGVLADIYRRATGRESAHAVPYDDGSMWHIAWPSPDTGHLLVAVLHESPTRYEAWVRALAAHYDLAARKDGTLF